jgi:hypothetical protein
MKKSVFIIIIFILVRNAAYAGFLTGNSSPYIEKKGQYAVKINSNILMVGTPFSTLCLACKYGYDEKMNVYAKYGLGTIDYTTVSGTKLTNDPQASAFGLEYIYNGTREAQYNSFVAEYETVSWSINKKSNISNEILLGFDFVDLVRDNVRTRYRVAINNFNSGTESEEKIGTSVKYSLSTELEYDFTKYIRGSFEAGIYFGDQNGIVPTFGLGLVFNS